MKKLLSEVLTGVNMLLEKVKMLEEDIQRVSANQNREASRQDIFHHRLISMEASLDHKMEVFGERVRQDVEIL